VTVSGPASLWLVDGDLFVGLLWNGTLDVLDGATVTSQAGIIGLQGPGGDVANVEGPGSVWSTIEDITVFSAGLLRIADGAVVLASVVNVVPDAELEADGTIVGDVDSNGTVRIGDPVGMLDVDGAFTTTGVLLLDLGGPTPGSFDAVVVSDAASIGGLLTVSLVDGYAPRFGDTFELLAAASIDGVFESLTLPALDAGLFWHFNQDTDSIDLVVTTLGDLDGDGVVGIEDFLLLLAAWGPCPTPPAFCPADLDGDGMVGINDFLILLALWS
jgi:T5SS/PEP-CTERM-associated repeat protein